MIRFLRPLAAAVLACTAAGAHAETTVDQQLWLNTTVIGTAGPHLAYFAEVQPRTGDGTRRIREVLLRGALGYKFSDAATLYGGYARILLPSLTGPDRHEDRFFGQLTWNLGDLAGGKVQSRTRMEYRLLSDRNDAGYRLRQMLRYAHPITQPDAPRALVWEEVFAAFNDTSWGARKGFDQARTFVGLEIPVKGGKSTVEVGYLNQYINDPGGRARMNHVASMTVWLRP